MQTTRYDARIRELEENSATVSQGCDEVLEGSHGFLTYGLQDMRASWAHNPRMASMLEELEGAMRDHEKQLTAALDEHLEENRQQIARLEQQKAEEQKERRPHTP